MPWVYHPETDDYVLEPDEEPGFVRKAWGAINTPLTHLAGVNLTEGLRGKLDEIAPKVASWASKAGAALNARPLPGTPGAPMGIPQPGGEPGPGGEAALGALAGGAMGAAEGVTQVAEGFTSPLNLATMGVGARVKGLNDAYRAAVAAGDVANAAKLAQQVARLQGPMFVGMGAMTGAGVQGAVEAPTWPEKLVSGAMAAGGLAGMAGAARLGSGMRGAGRVLTESLREPGGTPLDVSGPIEGGPSLAVPEGAQAMAGQPGKKASYIRRIEEKGLGDQLGNTTGMSAKQIRQWGEEHGVDFSDVVISRAGEAGEAAALRMTPEEWQALKARIQARKGASAAEKVRMREEARTDPLDELLRKRRVAEGTGDQELLQRIDSEIIDRWGRVTLVRARRGLPVDETTETAPTAEAEAPAKLSPQEAAEYGVEGAPAGKHTVEVWFGTSEDYRPIGAFNTPEAALREARAYAADANGVRVTAPDGTVTQTKAESGMARAMRAGAQKSTSRYRPMEKWSDEEIVDYEKSLNEYDAGKFDDRIAEQAAPTEATRKPRTAGTERWVEPDVDETPPSGAGTLTRAHGGRIAEVQADQTLVSQLQDPVATQLESAGRYMLDNMQRFVPNVKQFKNRLGHERYGRKQNLAEQVEGEVFALHGQGTGTLGYSSPRWADPKFTGSRIVRRVDNVHKAIIDAADQLDMTGSEVIQLMRQEPALRSAVIRLYRQNMVETLAHEVLHGLKDTNDTAPGGRPIPRLQERMNRAALELLDTPREPGGRTLRQELEAYLEPGSPATEAAWARDFEQHLEYALEAESIRNNMGITAEDASGVMMAKDMNRKGLNTKGIPKDLADELKAKVAAGFHMQWEGRGDANMRVRMLHNQQIQIRNKWTQKVRDEGLDPRQAHINAMEELKGLGAGIRMAGAPEFTPGEASALHGRVLKTGLDRGRVIGAADAMEKFIRGEQLQLNELKLMREVFGKQLVGGEPHWLETFLDAFYKSHGTLRALVTSFDLSAALRQGLLPTLAHPNLAAAAFKTMWKGMWTEAGQLAMEKMIFQRPLFEMGEQAGLHLSQPGGSFGLARSSMERVGGAEEVYTSSYAEKIPVIGKGVKISERAYILYLNKLRAELFDKMATQFMKDGISFEQQPQVYADLAKAVNTLTGRGDLELGYVSPTSKIGRALGIKEELAPFKSQGEMAIPFFNSMFFAPRFMAARLAILRDLPLLYNNYSAPVRNLMLRNVATTVITGLSVLSAVAAFTGGELEGDPRSADFGKLRVGNTRYDIWGGFQPWVRFAAQVISHERKNTTGARRVTKLKGRDMEDQFVRFFRQKLSPGMSLASETLLGKPNNEPVEFLDDQFPFLGRDLTNRLTPFIYQDFRDAWEQGELEQMAIGTPLSVLGVGVQSYGRKVPKSRRELP